MLILLIHNLRSLLTRCSSAGRGVVRRGFGNLYQQSVRIPVESDRPGSRRSVRIPSRCAQGLTILFLLQLSLFTTQVHAYDIDNSARVDAIVSATPTVSTSNTVTVDVTTSVSRCCRFHAPDTGSPREYHVSDRLFNQSHPPCCYGRTVLANTTDTGTKKSRVSQQLQ